MSAIPTTPSESNATFGRVTEGDKELRVIAVLGLGVHTPKPSAKFGAKPPAFKMRIWFEAPEETVTHTIDGESEDAPAKLMRDYNVFPGATRGHLFDFMKLFGFDAVPETLDDFKNVLGEPLQGEVVHNGDFTNLNGLAKLHPKLAAVLPEARSDIRFFDPYGDNEAEYLALSNAERGWLAKANDKANITFADVDPDTLRPESEAADDIDTDDIPF